MSRPPYLPNRRARRYWSPGRAARAVAVAVALLGGRAALADPPARREKPEEITVTGKQNPNPYDPDRLSLDRLKSVKKTQSVAVVPQILIEQQGATTLKDALRNVSGIGLNAGEGGAQGDDFTLRGYSAKTDIFIDGVRDQGSYQRDSFNLESVEVVKGPSSSYFGRGSTGGVVNQVSKTAREGDAYAGIVSSGMGPFNRASFDVNQQLSESVAVRLNLVAQQSEPVARDSVKTRRYGYAPSISFGLEGPTQLTLSYLYQKDNNVPDYGFPYVNGKPARVDRDTFFGSSSDFEKTDVNVATARLEHAFNDAVKLRNTTRYSHVDRAAAPTAARPNVNSGPVSFFNRGRPERDATESILANQSDLGVQFSTAGFEHSLSTGFEVAHEEFRLARFTNNLLPTLGLDPESFDASNPPAVTRALSQRANTRALSTGVFVADELELNPYVDLVGGLRYDRFAASFNDEFQLMGAPAGTTRPDFRSVDRMLSYRGGIAFHPTDEQNYYVSYGTSFNPSAEGLSLSAANQSLDPEKNRTIEIGGKIELRAGQLSLQGALFRIEKTNARETDPLDTSVQVLAGERVVRGFEVGVTGRLADGLVMFGSYTFLDSEITRSLTDNDNKPDDPTTLANDTEGNQVQRVPRHSATLWTSYRFPGQKLEIAGGPSYVSHRFSNDTNVNRIDGYTRWDATLGYAVTERVTLRLNLQNLTDKEYFESTAGGHAVPAAGRTAIASVSFTF